jgi:hypothetical protein
LNKLMKAFEARARPLCWLSVANGIIPSEYE